MGAIFGGGASFDFIEYQALMLFLAAAICLGLLTIELAMRRFQVLPVMFPGMFSVRERKFFFFDFEVRDGMVAEQLRWRSKVLIRMTTCVVMSYLWQRCVLETSQQVGKSLVCEADMDCFASELRISTLLTRSYEPIDCDPGGNRRFARDNVISCVRFVQPSATDWLMHIAIAHSMTQLNIKCFEVFVQLAGNSVCVRFFFAVGFGITVALLPVLFLTGVTSQFLSSWLSFVMAFSVPTFLWNVWRTSKIFQDLWEAKTAELQRSIETHLTTALADTPEAQVESTPSAQRIGMTWKAAQMANAFLRMSGLPQKIPSMLPPRLSSRSSDPIAPARSLVPVVTVVTQDSLAQGAQEDRGSDQPSASGVVA